MNEANFWKHELFDGLSQPQRLWLSERVEQQLVKSKTNIFQPNDHSSSIYFVESGRVLEEVFSGARNWLVTNIYCPGEFFGLQGVLGQQARRSQARTLRSKAGLIVIPVSAIQMLLEVNFDLATKIMKLANAKTQQVESKIAWITEKNAIDRFASFVVNLTDRLGHFDGSSWLLNSQLTQEEIGAYIGTGRQTVTEILNELKSKNILSYHWGRFEIHQLDQLKKGV